MKNYCDLNHKIKTNWMNVNIIRLIKVDLNRSCFRFCFLIGIGESGLVWKVEYLPTRLFFAMKIKNK